MTSVLPRILAESVARLHQYWSHRPVVILVPEFGGEARALVSELTACGASVMGVVTAGPVPAGEVPHVFSCLEHGFDVAPAEFGRWLNDPPAALGAWLDQLDPGRAWTAIGWSVFETAALFARPVHGHRRTEWGQWEDKTRVEEIWRNADIPSPKHRVITVDDPRAEEHACKIDRGLGVVVAHDTSQYCLGGGESVRRVRGQEEFAAALRWASERADRVRIAEFVPGQPCSTLGMVLADGVAVFDPIELVILAEAPTGRFEFCGLSNLFRPASETAVQLRDHVRSIGTRLAEQVNFRGLFSVDGILSPNGFVATELNPRQSSGLGLRRTWSDFPLNLFQRAAQEALPAVYGLRSSDVEDAFRNVARQHPGFTVRVNLPGSAPGLGQHKVDVVVDGTTRHVLFASDGLSANVLSIDPQPGPGVLLTPIAEALAQALGRLDLLSPTG